ncbi:MAG: PASTA domain-containing protein [Gemmatimonadota bacterium]
MKLGGSLARSRRRSSRKRKGKGGAGAAGTRGGARGSGGRRIWPLAIFLAVLGWSAGYLLATQVVFPAPPPPADLTTVPDVRGLGPATAAERFAGAGLKLGPADSLQHPTVPAGVILGQAPLPGQLAHPESEVRVTVSLGPQLRTVPDVVGLPADGARVVLEATGFMVTVDSVEADLPRGRVVAVDPPVDSLLALPGEVVLTVSTGPPLVTMPLVLGLQEEEAVAVLDSLGLVVGEIREVFRFGRDRGIVVEQEPAADTQLERGSAVRLSVGMR